MKSFYYFLVGISLLAFGFSGVATSINFRLASVYTENLSPRKRDRPQPKKHKEAKSNAKITHFSLLTGKIITTDALALPPSITAVKSVAVQGGGNAVPGSQLNYTIVINNGGTDATAVAFNDILVNDLTLVAGSVKATPIGVNDAYTSIGNVGITVPVVNGVLANDVSPDATAITASVTTNVTHGTLVLAANGSFTYTPTTGYTGSDSFIYTVTSANGTTSTNNTVTLTVDAPIWFVNIAAASNGDGSLASPFKDWSNFATSNALSGTVNPAASQTIFVYSGTYSGAATLKVGQKVLGQGATTTLASFAGVTLPTFSNTLPTTSGTNPNLTSSGTTITLASGNTLRGFDMGNSTIDISGTTFGTLTTSEITLNGVGAALNLSSGTLAANFTSITSSSSTTDAIVFYTVAGTLTSAGGTTITNPTGTGIAIYTNSSLSANFGNTSIQGSSSYGIIATTTTSNLTFGSLDITPIAGAQAIQVSSSGSFTCTSGTIGTSNTIGMAISGLNASSKLTLNVVLTSFSASGASSGFNSFNTLGSFMVTGSGTTSGSGGTIQNMTEDAVFMSGVTNITLKNMNFTNTNTSTAACTTPAVDNSGCNAAVRILNTTGLTLDNIAITGTTNSMGINLNNVSGFNLLNSTVTNAGSTHTDVVGSNETGGIYALNLAGTCAITNSNINGSFGRGFYCYNGILSVNPTVNLTVTNCQFKDSFTRSNGADNFIFNGYGTSNNTITIKSSDFSNPRASGLQLNFGNSSVNTIQVGGTNVADGNTITAAASSPGSNGFSLQGVGTSTINYNVYNNNFQSSFNGALTCNIGAQVNCTMQGRVNSNTVTHVDVGNANGISLAAYGSSTHKAEVLNNTISGTKNYGIIVESNDNTTAGSTARMDATVKNNTITMVTNAYAHVGINANANNAGTNGLKSCINVGNNTTNSPVSGLAAGQFDVLSLLSGNQVILQGATVFVPSGGNQSTVITNFWNANNVGTRTASDEGGGGSIIAGTCLVPSNSASSRISAPDISTNEVKTPDSVATVAVDSKNETVDEEVEEFITENEEKLSTETTNSSAKIAAPLAGETITVDGSGSGFSLPAGKSTTVTFSATVSSTPSTCAITNQASVSASGISTVNSNTTTTNVVVTGINAGSTISATSVCSGGTITLGAACPSGSQLNWFTASSGGSSASTSNSFSPTNITTATSYYASCTIGGCESARTLVGSVTLIPNNTVTLTSAVGTDAQTKCINTAITNITYSTTGATGATFSGLPAGVTGAWASNVVTISGSPTTTTGSPFSYTVTLTGGCGTVTATGTITVSSVNTVSLTSAAGTNAQTVCINTPITNITYSTTGATGATFSGLPAGVTGAWASNVVTISGSPTTTTGSPFSYTVTLTGGCGTVTATGTITVSPANTVSLTSAVGTNAQTKCVNTPITNITYSTTGATGATFSGLPAGVTGAWASNVVTISGTPTTATGSPFSYTVTLTGGCGTITATGTITVNSTAAPTAPTATPSTRTTAGSSTLSATGCVGGTLIWYNAADNVAVTSPNNQPNFTASGTFNFYAKCTGANMCESLASTNVSVSVVLCTPLASSPGNVDITWTGLVSTDWNTACNWSPAWVPDATNARAIIPNTTNKPIITGAVSDVKAIEIQTGALLTNSSTGILNVRGDGGTNKGIWVNKGTLTNNNGGTINIQSSTNTAINAYIYLTTDFSTGATFNNSGTVTINSTDEAIGVGNSSNQTANVNNTATGIINVTNGIGVEVNASTDILNFQNIGTINYNGSVLALKFLGTTTFTNTGTININSGTGIENPSGSIINNNACGKIFMTAGTFTNGGTTTNAGLIQLPNTYDFTNSGTFTNNGVVKANTVSSITNNKMVITNACPIFTLGGSNNYTVSGIFTDAGATIPAGTYTSVGNKFTANNTIPTGTQTLYAQVTNVPAEGMCTFVVPFDFDNVKPTAVSVNNTAICTGTSVTLLGTCPSGTTLTWYTTATGGSNIGTGTSLSNSPTVTTTYYASCEATNCISGRVATSEVTVSNPPFASASSNSPICAGTTLSLNSGSEGNTYVWRGPNSFTSTELSPSISNATVLAIGTYTITITNASNCTSTATTAVTVNAIPAATASSNSQVCVGNTISLTGGGVGTYLWAGPNSFTSTAQSPMIANATVLATGTYTITVTGTGSCTSTATTSVTVNALPTATASSSTPVICEGNTISLSAGGVGTYAWTGVNGFTSTDQNPSIPNASILASGTYKITVTNVSGCTSTAMTSVTVNAVPTATASSSTPVICVGNTISLTGGGVGTYLWSGPNSYSSTAQSPTIASATVLATGVYTITVTNPNSCTSTATTSVTVSAFPTATASSNSPICSGVTLNLIGGGGVSYAWSGPSGYTSTAQSPSIPSATASISGTYTITVTNINGCTSTATTSVTVNPVVSLPTPQANTQIIFGASITLTATGCSGVNDVLKWYKSSDNSLATMPVSPTATTNYYAKCETTLNGITCISANSADVSVTVLTPNPPVATGATNCLGTPTTLTATGCSGSVGTFVLKWYQNADDVLVTMPVSPTTITDYYAKCEQTFNSVTAVSAKSNVVTLTILNPPTPVSTGGMIYNSQSISLTATGCTGTLGTFTLKWYQTSDNALVIMPVSPTVTTQYYSKCEQTANSVTCLSAKSNDVTVTVVNRIFVDITKIAAPIQNGNSWATAYGNLQTGLAAATVGVEVWVAKGTYKPTATTDRNITFNIPNNVIVYGGFAGTEDNLIDRNFRTNISILSGDIGTLNLETDNSYHVVVMNGSSASTVLDGFTITGGYANFDPKRVFNLPISLPTTSTIETGGGIVVQNAGSPMIANCIISQNAAVMGGGLYVGDASTPNILLCKIIGNQAGFGSALYFQDGSHGKVNNTLISGNKGIGAVYNNTSNPMLTNVTFGGNGGYNGGVFNSNSQPVVKNSIFWGNSTPFNDTQSIITYSTIQGGYAGTGNLSMDPKYVSPIPDGLAPIITGNYHLQASSLAIDRGDNGTISLTDLDLDGNLRRFAGGRVDMGAYEFQGAATATLVISVATGSWEANSTWDVGRVPQLGDYVIIDNSHIVTLNGTGIAKNLEYRGTGKLKFNATTSKLEIGF